MAGNVMGYLRGQVKLRQPDTGCLLQRRHRRVNEIQSICINKLKRVCEHYFDKPCQSGSSLSIGSCIGIRMSFYNKVLNNRVNYKL